MARPSLTFEVIDEGTRLKMLRSELTNPRRVLTGIGALMVGQAEKGFREERMGDVRWKRRSETGMVPNWPAIIAHFHAKSSEPPNRYFGDQHTLQSTGRLAGSFSHRIANQDTVEAGTTLPYADALHRGLETKTEPLSEAVQTRLRKWIDGTRSKVRRAMKGDDQEATDRAAKRAGMAEALKWLLNPNLRGERLTVKHPARPMIGLPKTLVDDVKAIYGDAVEAA